MTDGNLISKPNYPQSLSFPHAVTLTFRSKKSPEFPSEEFLLRGPDDSESSLPPLDLAPESKYTFLRNTMGRPGANTFSVSGMYVLVSYYKMSSVRESKWWLKNSTEGLNNPIWHHSLFWSITHTLSIPCFLVPVFPLSISLNCCLSHYDWARFCSSAQNKLFMLGLSLWPGITDIKAVPADLAQEGGFSSDVPKMLEAILFFLTGCSVGSSKPNEKLDPPPGGRKTLGKMVKRFQIKGFLA